MVKWLAVASVALLAFIAVLLGVYVLQTADVYQVRIESPKDLQFEERMNYLGGRGWQPVSCRKKILKEQDFIDGKFDTNFIKRWFH